MADESKPKGKWLTMLYYYVAALVGLGFLMGGLVATLIGIRHAAFPDLTNTASDYRYRVLEVAKPDGEPVEPTEEELEKAKQEAREDARSQGLGKALDGVMFAAVGAPVFAWHLRQARRYESSMMGAAATTKGD